VQGQEAVGHHAERGVVMKASPTAALGVVQAHFALEFLVVALKLERQLPLALEVALGRNARRT
jgi:hypothetical protein